MKKLIFPTLIFAAMSLVVITTNAAPSCKLVLQTKVSPADAVKESLQLKGKTEATSYLMHFEGTPAEKFWSQKAADIGTEAEAVGLVKEVITSLRYLPESKWQKVMEDSMPSLLTRIEALDNMGVLDLAVITDIAKAQLQRAENFTDKTFEKTLLNHFASSFDSKNNYKGKTPERMNLLAAVEARESINLSFQRNITGIAAEQLYLSLNLPETKVQGVFKKILRATDRSTVLEINFDSTTGYYFATVKGDPRVFDQSQSKDVYRLNIIPEVRDYKFIHQNTPFRNVVHGFHNTEYVNSPWGRLDYLSIQNSDGKTDIELGATLRKEASWDHGSETQYAGQFFIEVPKNRDVYQGRETLKYHQSSVPKNTLRASYFENLNRRSLWDRLVGN